MTACQLPTEAASLDRMAFVEIITQFKHIVNTTATTGIRQVNKVKKEAKLTNCWLSSSSHIIIIIEQTRSITHFVINQSNRQPHPIHSWNGFIISTLPSS